jgi:formaldehyde-activating enzyme
VCVGLDAATIQAGKMQSGTGSAGDGVEAVQIDLLSGAKDGAMGKAWAYQLTYPRHGFEALTTILEPNLTVRPSTLIVPTSELKDLRQANMIYGPVQNAVARAIVDKLAEGVIPERAMHSEVMFVQAAVHPQALDRRKLHHNAYEATCVAIDHAFAEVR